MKNVMLACLFICLQAGTIQAQQNIPDKDQVKQSGHYQNRTPEQRATRQTKLMAQSLNLNSDQQVKVQALNLKRLTEMEALRQKPNQDSSSNRAGLGKETRLLRANWNTGLKAILSPEQYAKYEAQQTEMKNRRVDMARKNKPMPTE